MPPYILCVSLRGWWPCAESRPEGPRTAASPGRGLSSSRGSTLAQLRCRRTGHGTPCDLRKDTQGEEVLTSARVQTLAFLDACACARTSGVDASVDLHLRVRGDHAGPPGVGAHLGPHQVSYHKLLTEARLLDH